MTGQRLPPDLEAQAKGSLFYSQCDTTKPGSLARLQDLPGTNLAGELDRPLGVEPLQDWATPRNHEEC